MKQTEPIGFKGTEGEFYSLEYAGVINIQNDTFYGAKNVLDADNVGYDKMLANGNLLKASKKMAIALQNARNIFKDHHIKEYRELSESINEILKEAGLND